MAYAAVLVPEFPLAAWLRLHSLSALKPVVVLDGVAPLERVCSLNRVAEQLGVQQGMSRVQAETAGALRMHKRSRAEEQAAFRVLQEIALDFSPRIEALRSPENNYGNAQPLTATLLLDQTGTESLFGPREAIAHKLREAMMQAGFPARVAVSNNAHTAVFLARSREAVTCLESNAEAQALASLPVSVLEPAEDLTAILSRWGIYTLGELAALPQRELVSRLGQAGRRLQRLARGEEEYVLQPVEPEFSLYEHMALDAPVELLESLLFLLSPMLEALLRRARERAYALQRLTLTLALEGADSYTVELRPAVPTEDRQLLLKLLHLDLQTHTLSGGIVAITITAEPAKPQRAQRGLFQSQFPEPQKLDLLLSRLRNVVGEGRVGAPELKNTHQEDAFGMASFHPHEHESTHVASCPDTRIVLRRFRPQEPVRVRLVGERPAVLLWAGKRFAIAEALGPWQSSGGWWTREQWATDEWDVLIADPPQALRLCREQWSGRWSVVGVYD